MWKGRITFGSIDLPVKLYSAVTDKSIHFRLLDARNKEPVKQQMMAPDTGDVVPSEEVKTAYQTNAGELVLLDDKELEATEPKDSREIEITRFVDAADVSPAWYDRPYYLGPDEDSTRTYFASWAASFCSRSSSAILSSSRLLCSSTILRPAASASCRNCSSR